MATKQQRRQKKLERKKAKRKAVRKELVRRNQGGLATEFSRVSKAPVLDSCISCDLWEQGIGYVLLSRELRDGRVAFANFLVDVYCLGVKNVHADICSKAMYRDELYARVTARSGAYEVSPSYLRNLVEGAVDYARGLGLPPHADYRIAKELFGDIDASADTTEFEFGHEGKPYFISGPYDSPEHCRQIVSILSNTCGHGNFHYTVGMSASEFEASGLTLIDEEDDGDVDEVEGYIE